MGSKGEMHIKLTISMCNFACQRQMGLCPCSEFAMSESLNGAAHTHMCSAVCV